MLNNIFINENSLNKFSARTKQTDPTMALDQASSFAGALANQVNINQNNSTSSSSSTPTNSNQVSGQSSSNTPTPQENTPQQANNNNANNNNTAANQNNSSGTVENKQPKADNQPNTSNANNNTAQSNPEAQQAQVRTSTKNIDLPNNLAINITDTDKGLNTSDIKTTALPENFQKIIADVKSRNNKPIAGAEAKIDSNNKNNLNIEKTNLLADNKLGDNKNINLHQTEIKNKSRAAINNQNNNQTNLNLKADQDSVKFGARESIASSDKAFFNTQAQSKDFINGQNHLINNLQDQTTLDRHTHTTNTASNNPIFGLAAANTASVTSANANLQQGIIQSHINNPQWGNDLSRQMTNMIRIAGNGTQTAELRLDPPELGPLRVTINLNDGIVNAVFSSMHANVRNAIEQSLPLLQQQLQQEGLSLGQADVGQDNQDSQHAQNNNNKGNSFLTQNQENSNSDINVVQSNNRYVDPNALLDTYV